jgi:hypothetical protein
MVMEGWKSVEFRDWTTPAELIGYPLAVHASKRAVRRDEVTALIYKLEKGGDTGRATGILESAWEPCLAFLHKLLAAPKLVPHSSLLGTVTVQACLRNEAIAAKLGVSFVNDSYKSDEEGGWSDRIEHSNFGWCLANPRHFKPFVPATGQRGIWYYRIVPDHVSGQHLPAYA